MGITSEMISPTHGTPEKFRCVSCFGSSLSCAIA